MSRNFIVIDTEGVNNGVINPRNLGETALTYDVGFIVANREGEVLERFSFIVSDVFYNKSDLMQTAYYAAKIPTYNEGVNREWKVATFNEVRKTFNRICRAYNVRDIWAYNCKYDQAALNYTTNQLSNGFCDFFTPYGTRYRDIWDYAGSTICNTVKYVNWCRENGFISPAGNPRTNADTVGKYITNNLDFEEQHTALSDCEIELQILLAALKRHSKARHSKGQGWRDASKIARQTA